MEKSISIAMAIANQLHHEGRWPPNNLNSIMGSDYHYGSDTLWLFLTAVSWNLKNSNPSYDFQFDRIFVEKALALSVGELIGFVNENTK